MPGQDTHIRNDDHSRITRARQTRVWQRWRVILSHRRRISSRRSFTSFRMTAIKTSKSQPEQHNKCNRWKLSSASSSRALVIGVGGGGDVVGALATARFLEFCGLEFVLGGLSWERNVYDPIPGPRKAKRNTKRSRAASTFAWMANADSQTGTGVAFRRSQDGGGASAAKSCSSISTAASTDVVDGIEIAMQRTRADLLVGIDVGGDSLAQGR